MRTVTALNELIPWSKSYWCNLIELTVLYSRHYNVRVSHKKLRRTTY
jgi:hypothetical protein